MARMSALLKTECSYSVKTLVKSADLPPFFPAGRYWADHRFVRVLN